MKAPPDMTIADAILKAAENLGEDGAGKNGIIGWLEQMRVMHPEIFAIVMAQVKQKDTANG